MRAAATGAGGRRGPRRSTADFPLAALAAELRNRAGRLDALDAGDPAASVRAVFSWSYRQLSAKTARMFRLPGLHPGPDISSAASASLAAADEPEARRLLAELTRAHLVVEHVPGRYALHGLLRAYAADQARNTDSEPERAAAVGRVLDHYLHTARDGASVVHPSFGPIVLAPPSPGAGPRPQHPLRQPPPGGDLHHPESAKVRTKLASIGP
jgi:hypothetical protein